MHYRKTRRGNVVKIVEERYLRTDLGLGARHGKTLTAADMALPQPPPVAEASSSSSSASGQLQPLAWLVPDTNVVLHQLDLLEFEGCPHLDHVIILETVAEEVRHNNLAAHKRLVRLLKSERRRVVFFANEHSRHTYVRRNAGETPNDRNDRAIRVAAAWLGDQLLATALAMAAGGTTTAAAAAGAGAPVVLLSDDRLNREAARAMPRRVGGGPVLRVATARGFVRALGVGGLADLVAAFDDEDGGEGESEAEEEEGGLGGGAAKKAAKTAPGASASGVGARGGRGGRGSGGARGEEALFPPHLPAGEVSEGVLAGRLFQGVLRCSRGSWDDCYVVVKGQASGDSAEERVSVALSGPLHVNRAVEGDVVAVEILPRDQWAAAPDKVAKRSGGSGGDGSGAGGGDESAGDGAGVAEPTAPPRPGDLENVPAPPGGGGSVGGAAAGAAAAAMSPRGRVVGIMKRNWKHYCGSLAHDKDHAVAASSTGQRATSCLVVPVDKRIPRIRIVTRQREALAGKRLVVAIDDWPANSRYPRGHYVSTLGASGDKAVRESTGWASDLCCCGRGLSLSAASVLALFSLRRCLGRGSPALFLHTCAISPFPPPRRVCVCVFRGGDGGAAAGARHPDGRLHRRGARLPAARGMGGGCGRGRRRVRDRQRRRRRRR